MLENSDTHYNLKLFLLHIHIYFCFFIITLLAFQNSTERWTRRYVGRLSRYIKIFRSRWIMEHDRMITTLSPETYYIHNRHYITGKTRFDENIKPEKSVCQILGPIEFQLIIFSNCPCFSVWVCVIIISIEHYWISEDTVELFSPPVIYQQYTTGTSTKWASEIRLSRYI